VSVRRLTVVAPVYNEEDVIAQFYERTRQVLAELSDDYVTTIVFVLDRSTDRTLQILKTIAARDLSVQVISLSSRFGHQMSLLAGIDYSGDADLVVMMDSDLQHPPETIPELLSAYEDGNDIVYTIRRESGGVSNLRKAVGWTFYRLIAQLSAVSIDEGAADFRLISKRVVNLMRTEIRERNMFLRGLFSWVGFSQTGVEYVAAERGGGTSKYTLTRMFALATAGILSFSTRPLLMGVFLGLGFAGASFVLALGTIAAYFLDNTIPSGWSTIVLLLLMFNGVQFMMMGILGAYVGNIHDEVKGRPHYILDETINVPASRS
jgi:glycosyltransferase involved in cell wall biosynthesis